MPQLGVYNLDFIAIFVMIWFVYISYCRGDSFAKRQTLVKLVAFNF